MTAYEVIKDTTAPLGGTQRVVRFPNGYGASIVCGPHSYGGRDGLYELAVIEFPGAGPSYSLTYETPITDDVLGYLTDAEVEATLVLIGALPEVGS